MPLESQGLEMKVFGECRDTNCIFRMMDPWTPAHSERETRLPSFPWCHVWHLGESDRGAREGLRHSSSDREDLLCICLHCLGIVATHFNAVNGTALLILKLTCRHGVETGITSQFVKYCSYVLLNKSRPFKVWNKHIFVHFFGSNNLTERNTTGLKTHYSAQMKINTCAFIKTIRAQI